MMLAKRAIDAGASPWTGTFLANIWLALFWALVAIIRGDIVPSAAWPAAATAGALFVLGQLFTYLAFQYGDVSVAAPIFGVKVLIVAVLASLMTDTSIAARVWIAGAFAAAGVLLIQWSNRTRNKSTDRRSPGLTIILALSAAVSLSLFDVCMQMWGPNWNSYAFLPVLFITAALLSIAFLPKVDSPARLRKLKVGRWIVGGTLLMAVQAMSICFSLSTFGDATRINIVYSLRGLWGVIMAWLLARQLQSAEADLPRHVMLQRLAGAALLTAAVFMAISA